MSLLAKNLFKTLLQGSQCVTKALYALHAIHTSMVNTDSHYDNISARNASTLQSHKCCAKCTLIPGDGIGPELMNVVQEIFKAMTCPVEFETIFLSEVNPSLSAPLDDVVKSITKNQVCIKGIIAHPDISLTGELATLNMKLRTALDLFANVVHVQSMPNVKARHKDVDCIIIREQTEGEYSALEHEAVPGVAECLKIVTAKKSLRIAKFAFDYAVKMGRKKVTSVHKANIMKLGDGLFLKSCEDMSKLYPRIKFEKMIVDNCTMQIVSNPHQFDVMVTPNLYGNIVANVAAGLVGGAGIVPGANYSAKCAVFEQGARHIFSEAVGKNIANPTAIIMCAVEMLAHMNLGQHARIIKAAVNKVLIDGKVRTEDLGGTSSTKDFTAAVIENLDIK